MIIDQLPVLQVIVPLLSAPLALLCGRGQLAWLVAMLASVAAFVISILLLQQVSIQHEVVTEIGGWAAPWGIEYRVDYLNSLVLLLVSGISSICLWFAQQSVASEVDADRQSLFYTAWLLCLTGLLGITITGDAFNVFVFLEISSLSSYVLIAMGRDRRALSASFQYLVMGTIGATFILIGIGLLYMASGSLNMKDIAGLLPNVTGSRMLTSAFAFLTVGIGLKLAMFPLHLWLPNAYTYAPSAVSAFLAGTATKVAVYMLLRFIFSVFGVEFSFQTMPLSTILLLLGAAAILVTSLVAIFQDNLKRMLAYSSVAQVGYMLLGISLASHAGLSAAILHVFNHALIKGGLFLVLGCLVFQTGTVSLDKLSGVAKQMPWTMAAFLVGGLSLIGVPLTTGFVSKWLLISAALQQGMWPIAVVVVLGSLLAVIYIWRVVEVAYMKPGSEEVSFQEAPIRLLLPTWILIAANFYFGIFTEINIGVSESAATWLFEGKL
ncbi:MAG: multicomponent Na+:H+ antiporter subunit D [Parasphingorhabdus sp.]|jgi:multicomponent Na+:H+ antiporter subunit D